MTQPFVVRVERFVRLSMAAAVVNATPAGRGAQDSFGTALVAARLSAELDSERVKNTLRVDTALRAIRTELA